jgi:hypothetical protein
VARVSDGRTLIPSDNRGARQNQPAQKWLKDRRGRALSYDDIGHYQKIVKILAETDRIMKEIELPLQWRKNKMGAFLGA